VEADRELLAAAYRGRRVLVTGAGGSIGRELARQVMGLEPAALVLVGRGENSLFETDLVLRDEAGAARGSWELALVDVQNRIAVDRLFRRTRPEVVLRAAHKHVNFRRPTRRPCSQRDRHPRSGDASAAAGPGAS
jgi:FlaA1/EpsC-like NDP-sugar epimerase